MLLGESKEGAVAGVRYAPFPIWLDGISYAEMRALVNIDKNLA
jgi:hypothetical protein